MIADVVVYTITTMIGFNHALSGSLVAVFTPAEYQAFIPLFAFLLHFVLDTFPHYGRDDTAPTDSRKFKNILKFDAVMCVLVVALACWLYPDKILWIGIGSFFAVLPDFLWIFKYYLPIKNRLADLFFALAAKIQWGERPWAWSLEILYAMIMLVPLIVFS